MNKKSEIKSLLAQTGDPHALESLIAQSDEVLPVLQKVLLQLEVLDLFRATWYARVLGLVAPDPVGEVLGMLEALAAPHGPALAWILRKQVTLQDAPRLRQGLATQVANGGYLGWIKLAVLAEGLGLAGEPGDVPFLDSLFREAEEELQGLKKEGALSLCGPETAPGVAACAAALLSISERWSLPNEAQRKIWRSACVETALSQGYASSYALGAAPMPFLFMRAPLESLKVLQALAECPRDNDDFVSDLRNWLLQAREQELTVNLEASDGWAWLDTLEESTLPGSPGAQWLLDVRAQLQPLQASALARGTLMRASLGHPDFRHAAHLIQTEEAFQLRAAIAVEATFVACSLDKEGLKGRSKEWKHLNQKLRQAGLPTTRGWDWPVSAPLPPALPDARPHSLDLMLQSIALAVQTAAKAKTAAAMDSHFQVLKALPASPILQHARWRCLLVARAEDSKGLDEGLLDPLQQVEDTLLLGAVLTMARDLQQIIPVAIRLLKNPAVQQDEALGERAVRALAASGHPEAGQRIQAFGEAIGWKEHRGNYGVYLAINESLGRLVQESAVKDLIAKIGCSGLGSEIELALLEIAAKRPQAVPDADFRRAFEAAARDSYARPTPSHVGEQARRFISQILAAEGHSDDLLRPSCQFLIKAAKASWAPPQAIPSLLRRLPFAVQAAHDFPGREWEDRNWGGYEMSGAEESLDAIHHALLSLFEARYTREGWSEMLSELLQAKIQDLHRVPSGEYTGYSFSFCVVEVFAKLKRALHALKDPEINCALELKDPLRALQGVLRALNSGDSRSR